MSLWTREWTQDVWYLIGRLKCATEDFFTCGLEVCLVSESYQAGQKKRQKEEERRAQQEESSLKKE